MDHRPNLHGRCRRCGSPSFDGQCERAWFGPWELQRNSSTPYWLRLRLTDHVIVPIDRGLPTTERPTPRTHRP